MLTVKLVALWAGRVWDCCLQDGRTGHLSRRQARTAPRGRRPRVRTVSFILPQRNHVSLRRHSGRALVSGPAIIIRLNISPHRVHRGLKCAENYTKWHDKFIFRTAISILLILNHNSFRVLFDKIASAYFIWKMYLYFSIGNGQVREPALCQLYIGTLAFSVARNVAIDTDVVHIACCVCVSTSEFRKTDEPIEMPFGDRFACSQGTMY